MSFQKILQGEKHWNYLEKIETKAAVADRANQLLKLIIYRYMEDHGKKFVHKLSQVILIRFNRLIVALTDLLDGHL